MDLLELSWGEMVGATVVGLDVPVQTLRFFEEPDDALGAGLVEPGIVSILFFTQSIT